jgi:hypothetical protein
MLLGNSFFLSVFLCGVISIFIVLLFLLLFITDDANDFILLLSSLLLYKYFCL